MNDTDWAIETEQKIRNGQIDGWRVLVDLRKTAKDAMVEQIVLMAKVKALEDKISEFTPVVHAACFLSSVDINVHHVMTHKQALAAGFEGLHKAVSEYNSKQPPVQEPPK